MKKKHQIPGLVLLLNLFEIPGFAEAPAEKLESREFIIEKERIIILPEEEPISEAISVNELAKLEDPNIYFNFKNITPDLGQLPTSVKMLRAQGEIAEKFYSAYLKLGHSTSPSPLLEFGYARDYDAECNYGLYLKHSSRGGGLAKGYFQDYKNALRFFAEKYFSGGILTDFTTGLGYDKFSFHQNPSATTNGGVGEEARSIFSPSIKLRVRNFNDTPLKYDARCEFYRCSAAKNFYENAILPRIDLKYSFLGEHRLSSKIETFISKHQNRQTAKNRFAINTLLLHSFSWKGFELKYGATFNADNDTRPGGWGSYFLNTLCPTLSVEYNYEKWLKPYFVMIEASNNFLSLRDLLSKNALVDEEATLINQRALKLGDLGVKGMLWDETLTYRLGASIKLCDKLFHFENSPNPENNFKVFYDSVMLWNPYVAFSTKFWEESLVGHLNISFSTPILSQYMGPKFSASISAKYKVNANWLLNGSMELAAGHRGALIEKGTRKYIDLDAVGDAKLGVDYLYSDRWTVFATVDNLLDRPNLQFLGTRPSGIKLTAGVVYAFF